MYKRIGNLIDRLPQNAERLRMCDSADGKIRVTTNQEVVGEELVKFAPAIFRAAAHHFEQKNKPLAKILPHGGTPGGGPFVN